MASSNVAGRGDVYLKLNVNRRLRSCKLIDVLHVPAHSFAILLQSVR